MSIIIIAIFIIHSTLLLLLLLVILLCLGMPVQFLLLVLPLRKSAIIVCIVIATCVHILFGQFPTEVYLLSTFLCLLVNVWVGYTMHTRLFTISLTGSQLLPVMKMMDLHLSVTTVAV